MKTFTYPFFLADTSQLLKLQALDWSIAQFFSIFLFALKVRFYQKLVICSSYQHTDEPFFVPQFQIRNLPHYYVKETM